MGGVKEEIVSSVDQVLALLARGQRRKHVGETDLNEHSSRSHSIFKMVQSY